MGDPSGKRMREKELRLALVLYGGVSLAVYMFGVCHEVSKLVRASKLFHGTPRPDRERPPGPEALPEGADTEAIYFELIHRLAADTELRVIVDVIAGASAGGINGVFLARALAHDLPLAPLRDMWLDKADVTQLIEEDALAGRWSKRFLTPFVGRILKMDPALAENPETRAKLDLFVRSRWFQPPFSGPRFSGWMLEAAEAMGVPQPGASLLPDDHALDLFVSVTDYHGHPRTIPLDDPPLAVELEHQLTLPFRYLRHGGGDADTEFDAQALPGLVFAARATSSFPGAFPAATLQEIEAVIASRGTAWPGRERFIRDKLGVVLRDGRDPRTTPFVDGAVVTNKPFAAAVSALMGRPANREVVRRIVFVDPNPDVQLAEDEPLPGFFRAIFTSLAQIPRNEPIHHELERLAELNSQISVVSDVVEAARPRIRSLVERILEAQDETAPQARTFAVWRDAANEAAAMEAGFAFESYLRLKILTVARRLREIVETMADASLAGLGQSIARPLLESPRGAEGRVSAEAIAFLRAFDVDFRIRRLRFVVRHLNDLYHADRPEAHVEPLDEARLDELKAAFYALLDSIRQRLRAPPEEAGLADALRVLADPEASAGERTGAAERFGAHLALKDDDDRLDEIFSVLVLNNLPFWARHELIVAYIGFPFFDVLTLPMTQWQDLDELDIIRVFRISPSDARAIRAGTAMDKLKGVRLRRFGAFFNRAWRENDYLWGRLVAADRLVDIVMTAAGEAGAGIEPLAVKKALFEAILKAEAPHLIADPGLVPGLMEEVANIKAPGFGI